MSYFCHTLTIYYLCVWSYKNGRVTIVIQKSHKCKNNLEKKFINKKARKFKS